MNILRHHYEFDTRDRHDEPYHCVLRIHMTEDERHKTQDFMHSEEELLYIVNSIREQLIMKISKRSRDV